MENAGTQTAMYSAPPSPGVLYWTHSPRCAITAWPARTSIVPCLLFTRSNPCKTIENSSNSGVCPGSHQPSELFIRAMLIEVVPELTRPMNSSISLGLLPAASMMVGSLRIVGIMYLPGPVAPVYFQPGLNGLVGKPPQGFLEHQIVLPVFVVRALVAILDAKDLSRVCLGVLRVLERAHIRTILGL